MKKETETSSLPKGKRRDGSNDRKYFFTSTIPATSKQGSTDKINKHTLSTLRFNSLQGFAGFVYFYWSKELCQDIPGNQGQEPCREKMSEYLKCFYL